MARLFSTIVLRTGEVEWLMRLDQTPDGWQPRPGTPGVLVDEHVSGVFEAELFEEQGDATPVALAVVTDDQVHVTWEPSTSA